MMKKSFEAILASFLQFYLAARIFFIWLMDDSIWVLTFSSVYLDYCKKVMIFSSSMRLVFDSLKISRILSSIFFIFCSLSDLFLISSFLLVQSWTYIFWMTTDVNCSSRPFYLTVKLTKRTFVVTSGLYLGFGSLVVMQNLKFSLYLMSLSPK